MGVLDGIKVNGFGEVEALLRRALGDLAEPWGVFGAKPGMTLEAIRELLGTPTFAELDLPEQRTLTYEIPLDHPVEGPRDHHRARVVVSSYHGGPVQAFDLALMYFPDPEWKELTTALRAHLETALGKPAKKGKTDATWSRGDEQLWLSVKPGELQLQISG